MPPSSVVLSATEVIAAFHRGELEGEAFLKALVAVPRLIVPSEPSDEGALYRVLRDDSGTRWFTVYTDEEAVIEARAQSSEGSNSLLQPLMLDTTARRIVQSMQRGDGLQINPDTTRALHFRPHQLPMLKRALYDSPITEALARAATAGVPAETLRQIGYFPDFRVVARTASGAAVLDLAPDSQGRRLLAAFTSEGACRTYLAAVRALAERFGRPNIVELSGEELAIKLGELEIHGVVFDCAGPGRPYALHMQLGERVIQAMNAE